MKENPLLILLAASVPLAIAGYCIRGIYQEFRKVRDRHEKMRGIQAERDFLNTLITELMAQARQQVSQAQWKEYGRTRKQIHGLVARWDREVTNKLHNL